MPPHKCENTSETKSMFRFPWNDANRLKVWLNNSGNMTIGHLSPESLRSRYLCIDHFDKQYVSETKHRKRLRREAIPEQYQAHEGPVALNRSRTPSPGSPDLKVLTPPKVYRNKRKFCELPEELNNTIKQSSWSTPKKRKCQKHKEDKDTPKCKKLKTLLLNSNKKLKRELMKNKNKNVVDLSKHKFRSETSRLLTTMQLRRLKKVWNDEEKKFCMSLFYKSPAAYKFMIKSGIVLAAPSTIQRWLQETNCLPGINDEIFVNIKNKFAGKSIKERACAVCFDEMSIMVDLEYTNKYDLIEGFEDFGGGNRNKNEAKYALVFIARGIYINWKIPVAYFLSSKNVDSNKLRVIVDSVINKLFESGLLPKVTVCDQATTNVKLIKDLGASVDFPFFFIYEHKIYAICDTPHLIKNIRNNLLHSDFELNGNHISFNDIIAVYNIDKNNKSKCLRKLTPVHINPNNFQKMKVKLATQVLSNSVAGAIKTAIDSGELKSSTAKHTADFVQLSNDLFDCLNSKNKFDSNPYKCAITKNRNTAVNQILLKGKEIFSKLNKISTNHKSNSQRLTRPTCFDGMIQTINAVLQLTAEEFSKGTGVNFLITYRLNQDVIENLFGIYRIKGGCNKNPTSKSLRSMFRSNLLNNLMKFDKTNCETDQEMFLSAHQNIQRSNPSTSSATPSKHGHRETTEDNICDTLNLPSTSFSITATSKELTDSSKENITMETCSVVYFAGWLGKSYTEKFDCSDCKKILLKNQVDLTDKKQLLLINKTYSNIITPTLKSPSENLIQLVNKGLDFYNENINQLHKINLIADLMQRLKNKIDFTSDYHDLNHFDYLIKKLLEVKIHDYCKTRKKSLQAASKLRILQNK